MAARCLLLVWVKSAKHPPAESECIPGTRQMLGHIAIRVVLSWALFPAMAATGTDWIFANLFWMGG